MHLTINIDGSCVGPVSQRQAGYGVIIETPNGALVHSSLHVCGCSNQPQTNNRAELRALLFALRFIHELAKVGAPSHDCDAIANDGRSISSTGIVAVIRTDSEYVVKGFDGRNKVKTHRDLWESVVGFSRCLRNSGAELRVVHVRGHSGDDGNEEADRLAVAAATAWSNDSDYITCCSCGIDCASAEELATHFKRLHEVEFEGMDDDILENSARVSNATAPSGTAGPKCPWCPKEFGSRNALLQHSRDKHSRDLATAVF